MKIAFVALLLTISAVAQMTDAALLKLDREFAQVTASPSARLVGFSAAGILIVLTGIYTWIRVGVVYQIPIGQQSMLFEAPPPPPPPNLCKCPDRN